MNPIDGAGNLLNEKDAVVVHVTNSVLRGQVAKIKEASIILSSGKHTPGLITIYVPITIIFDPSAPAVRDVYKIVKPPNWDKPES